MRIPRPKTLLGLTLFGLGLVTLPLLLAVGRAVLELDELMQESGDVVTATDASTLQNQRMLRALENMERYGRQTLFLRGTERGTEAFQRYRDAVQSLSNSIDALQAQTLPAGIDDDLGVLAQTAADVTALVERIAAAGAGDATVLTGDAAVLADDTALASDAADLLARAARLPVEAARLLIGEAADKLAENAAEEAIIAEVGRMRTAAGEISNGMRDMLAERRAVLEQDIRSAQEALAWQAAALIPGVLLLVLFFVLLVGRPIRQIDRAIRDLGEGDFSREIAVSGPADIETLGRQLEWLRVRLEESSEEKNRFLRHMSHELKTPLANIREGTELLLDGSVGALGREQQEVTDILRENSVKLQRLIEDLLTFSAWQAKTAALEISRFELEPLVRDVLDQHRLVIANRAIDLELDVAPISVEADEGKITLVLENLLSNAIKFTPENGTITVRAGMDRDDLVIEVADSGPGVAPEDRERIFEAFYQGRRQQGGAVRGTGIGLSVVSECVQAHGGTIELLAESPASRAGSPESRAESPEPRPEPPRAGAHFVARLPLGRASHKPRLVASA